MSWQNLGHDLLESIVVIFHVFSLSESFACSTKGTQFYCKNQGANTNEDLSLLLHVYLCAVKVQWANSKHFPRTTSKTDKSKVTFLRPKLHQCSSCYITSKTFCNPKWNQNERWRQKKANIMPWHFLTYLNVTRNSLNMTVIGRSKATFLDSHQTMFL